MDVYLFGFKNVELAYYIIYSISNELFYTQITNQNSHSLKSYPSCLMIAAELSLVSNRIHSVCTILINQPQRNSIPYTDHQFKQGNTNKKLQYVIDFGKYL